MGLGSSIIKGRRGDRHICRSFRRRRDTERHDKEEAEKYAGLLNNTSIFFVLLTPRAPLPHTSALYGTGGLACTCTHTNKINTASLFYGELEAIYYAGAN